MKIKYGLMIVVLGMLVGQAGAETMSQGLPKLKDKHITIHPKKPAKDGINSGLVILFGHPVPPPYKIEYRGQDLFVNDVQAKPSPLWDEQIEKPRKARTEQDKAFLERMLKSPAKYKPRRELMDWIYAKCPFGTKTDSERGKILEYVLAQKEWIESAQWVSKDRVLKLKGRGMGNEMYITCSKPKTESLPPGTRILTIQEQKAQDVQLKNAELLRLQKILSNGGCLLYSTENEEGFLEQAMSLFSVMRDKDLSADARAKHLDGIVSTGMVEDLITNYIPEEWNAISLGK